jgi:hypothetical protein
MRSEVTLELSHVTADLTIIITSNKAKPSQAKAGQSKANQVIASGAKQNEAKRR